MEQLRRQVLLPQGRPTTAADTRTGRIDSEIDTKYAFQEMNFRALGLFLFGPLIYISYSDTGVIIIITVIRVVTYLLYLCYS